MMSHVFLLAGVDVCSTCGVLSLIGSAERRLCCVQYLFLGRECCWYC